MTRRDRLRAAAILRSVLSAVDEGRMVAPGPRGSRVARRLEGAVSALEVDAGVWHGPVGDAESAASARPDIH